jgi:hypothetical protein
LIRLRSEVVRQDVSEPLLGMPNSGDLSPINGSPSSPCGCRTNPPSAIQRVGASGVGNRAAVETPVLNLWRLPSPASIRPAQRVSLACHDALTCFPAGQGIALPGTPSSDRCRSAEGSMSERPRGVPSPIGGMPVPRLGGGRRHRALEPTDADIGDDPCHLNRDIECRPTPATRPIDARWTIGRLSVSER